MEEKNLINQDSYFSGDTPKEIIESTITEISKILAEFYPEHLSYGDGSYTISRGSTQVMIVVRPFTEKEACVECIATVVSEPEVSFDLMRFLLRKNSELHFGAFGLLFDDTITFTYSFSSGALSSNELRIALESVAIISDYYDDIIVDIAGGKRAKDMGSEL